MLTQEMKDRWLEALRSGDYNKGEVSLKSFEDGKVCHCAIGVLLEIHPDFDFEKRTGYDYVVYDLIYKGENFGVRYEPIIELFGDSDMVKKIWTANDSGFVDKNGNWQEYLSFAELADYFEKIVDAA